jgi:hypothetical protein
MESMEDAKRVKGSHTMKTHYQAPWTKDNEAVCNGSLIKPNTSAVSDNVDCKRCIKVIHSYTTKGLPVRRKGNGVSYFFKGLLNGLKWWLRGLVRWW